MNSKPLFITLTVTFLIFGFSNVAYSDEPENKSCTFIVREQLQNIADEVVSKASFDSQNSVAVIVEGEEPRSLAENAFLQALQKYNYSTFLSNEKKNNQALHISILDVNIKVKKIPEELMERTVQTIVEAKVKRLNEDTFNLLGTFRRQVKDTAEVFTSAQIGLFGIKEESNIMQRILTPFIVIGGVVTIVYLFFTVRS